MATVSVVEDADGVARLRINNRQQEGSSATLFADARQALLPLLLHPAPRHALFLGLGTGVTASSAAQDPALVVDAVELLPEVIDASVYFRQRLEDGAPNPRLNVVPADARRFVRATSRHYDVIVSDNFHPARSGSGSLYTVEHFRAVRDRLAPGGLFCQWLPLHQLDLDTLRSIVRAFVAVYPDGWALLATNSLETPVVGLVAILDADRFDVGRVRARLADSANALGLAGFGIDDEFALLGSFIAGPRALARFAGDAPLNTDDHPVVAYRAPRITYVPDSTAGDRLIALLRELQISPDEVARTAEPGWENRLAAYWTARDRFIEAGRGVQPTADVRRMLAQVREPLLSVLRTSPDFRPAYDPLLQMALALAEVDAAAAGALLVELSQIQPARPEAAQALQELSVLPR
jgi:spermidine synthase